MRISDWSSDVCSSDLGAWNIRKEQLFGIIDPAHHIRENSQGAAHLDGGHDGQSVQPVRQVDGIAGPDDHQPCKRHETEYAQWITDKSEEHTSELQSVMRIS